jgi:anti-anti-sigma regulatory factor/anti-sigma regulatory factor (Ser/Thr protein kinase)
MITTRGNIIKIVGKLEIGNFHNLLAAFYDRVEKKGYQDVVLDFSECIATFAGPMSAICTQVCKYRHESMEFKLILPEKDNLRRLFKNTNWAYLIDPINFERSSFRGQLHVPITQFSTTEEQTTAVNTMMDAVMGSLTDFSRSDLAAIEWSLNEITDNVINHAQSKIGGFLQLSTFRRNHKHVEYTVCDAGIGIPESIRTAKPNLIDVQALDFAIKEGHTRDEEFQGNGLFGAYQISRVGEGYMEIHSGYGRLVHNKKHETTRISRMKIPFNGTLIVSSIDYANPDLLGKALKFGGKQHNPVDFIETMYEDSLGNIVFIMNIEAPSFGSRKAAEPVSRKLKNLAAMSGDADIIIDFTDVVVISSSFADEVFGKLYLAMGPEKFKQKFKFRNLENTVKNLIDRAIMLRSTSK